ncbi:MAG: regulatory protein RecX [Candidatus Eisenbacteria bacterium]|nr:regulatory protein RecX [Candidatus Eisenbacteria bacterium]
MSLSGVDAIREEALRALERRRRTRSEVATILRRKGGSAAEFDPVLDRLTEVGLIDDLQYARVYLEHRAAGKPRGARLLRSELQAKGVPGPLIDQALAERRDEHDPLDDAMKALRPKLNALSRLPERDRKRKAWEFLARRGFSGDVIERAALAAFAAGSGFEAGSGLEATPGLDD